MHDSYQHIPQIVQKLEPFVTSYGYLGVGFLIFIEDFGVPAPGETVLIAAAFFAGLGKLDIFVVGIIAFLAAFAGDNIGFLIGKYGGHPLVLRFGKYVFITHERLNKAEKFFRGHGGKIVAIARFVEGLRQLNGIIAGLSEMHWKRFAIFNAIGAALWVSVWASAGYFGGSHIATLLRYQLYFTIAVIVGIIAYVTYHIKRRRSSKR